MSRKRVKPRSEPRSPPAALSAARARPLLIALGLGALFALVVVLKIHHQTHLVGYDPTDGDNHYWTETAFHFRHAEMVAAGGDIPALDTGIQYPEGLDTRRYITPVMERAFGSLYRLLGASIPLHVFLIRATAVFSTLSIVALFIAGWALSARPAVGLAAAILYGLIPGSMARSAGLIREDFALPLLLGGLACLIACVGADRLSLAAASALLLVLGLASWHVGQFFWLLVVAGFALVLLVDPDAELPRRSLSLVTAAVALASLGLPVLRAKLYVVSPPMALTYALMVMLWLVPRGGRLPAPRRRLIALALFGGSGLAAVLMQRLSGSQSHVLALLVAKLRHLGRIPADPSALSFEARAMWTSSFVSPALPEIALAFSTSLLLAGLGLAVLLPGLRRRRPAARELLLLSLTGASFVLYLLVQRLEVFAVFFVALLPCLAWPQLSAWQRRLCVALFVVCPLVELVKFPYLRFSMPRPPRALVADLTRFLATQTGSDEAVLTSFELGPAVAAYAHRPVLIHSKFESEGLRAKVQQVYEALFASEAELYALCRRYGAAYVVLQADMALGTGPGSLRYMAGQASLSTSSAVFGLHFTPERLEHFELVHENQLYRVFRVTERRDPTPLAGAVSPVYDLREFAPQGVGAVLADAQITAGLRRLEAGVRLVPPPSGPAGRGAVAPPAVATSPLEALLARAEASLAGGRYAEALALLDEAIALAPADARAHTNSCYALAQLGRLEEAARACRRATELAPELFQPRFGLATVLETRGELAAARAELEIAVRLAPMSLEAQQLLADISIRLGHSEAAVAPLRQLLRLGGEHWQARRDLARILATDPDSDSAAAAEAVGHALRAAELTGYRDADVLDVLAAAHAAAGDRAAAVAACQRALALDPTEPGLAVALRQHLELYRRGERLLRPREPSSEAAR